MDSIAISILSIVSLCEDSLDGATEQLAVMWSPTSFCDVIIASDGDATVAAGDDDCCAVS